MKYIFGVPFYKYNVKTPKSILDDIHHNYDIDSNRNSWDNKSYLNSKTHHSNRDRNNPKFKEVNYKPIMPEYKKVFDTFMRELDLDCQYKWTIANYTAMKSQQYMRAHDHIVIVIILVFIMQSLILRNIVQQHFTIHINGQIVLSI